MHLTSPTRPGNESEKIVVSTYTLPDLPGDGGSRPDGILGDAIAERFGSFDAFAAQMTTAATGVQGSGRPAGT
jgi:superoxide dismutase, Fe-Mn family